MTHPAATSARLVQTESAGRRDVALGALTVLGLPFGLVFAVGSVLGTGLSTMLWCLGISVGVVVALHTARGVRDMTWDLLAQVVGVRSRPHRRQGGRPG
jgi:hypothetical protein